MSVGKALLSVQNIVKGYGAQPVLDRISLTIHEGDRIGFIGRNGSGKSTLMRILSGQDTPEEGLVTRTQGLRVALLSQQCMLDRDLRVEVALDQAAAESRKLLDDYHAVMERMAHIAHDSPDYDRLHEHAADLQHAIDVADAWNLPQLIKRVSVALDLPEPERVLGSLSGGELRRVDLATKLIQHPDVLMLDEPTNHIDTRSVEWIEQFLQSYTGSCVLVTHDRFFLDRAVNRIVELEFNKIYSFPGNYSKFLEYKAVLETSIAQAEDNRLSFLRRELDWVRRGPKARGTKAKARMDRYQETVDQGPPQKHREFMFEIPEPGPLGKTVLEARDVYGGYDGHDLIQGFNLVMQKGMRIGILGPNGAGKSTLLRLLLGKQEPRKGKIIVGELTQFLYVPQTHEDVPPEQTIIQFVSNGMNHWEVNKRRISVPGYLERFLFDRAALYSPMGNLSGGERNRLVMAKQLLRGGNFLVLDEPTNDLDLYTLRVLEETIEAFQGCCLIVSHDRYFLNRVCTHMLIFEEDGKIVQIAGNYDDYVLYVERREEDRRAASADVRATPKEPVKPIPVVPVAAGRKLTYSEKRELEGMEAAILAAEDHVRALEEGLAAPGFYEQPHAAVQAAIGELNAAKSLVASLYARWEELEQIRGGA